MSYSDVVATLALLISVLGTFLSGYFSYRFAIKGEKRKEFNAAADKVTLSLLEQRNSASRGLYLNKTLKEAELRPLLLVCDDKESARLLRKFEVYEKALETSGSWVAGRWDFHSPHILIKAIDEFLPHCKHR